MYVDFINESKELPSRTSNLSFHWRNHRLYSEKGRKINCFHEFKTIAIKKSDSSHKPTSTTLITKIISQEKT